MRLIVFSGVHHHTREGQIVAHGGFVREMDVWAHIFERVVVVAPLTDTLCKDDDVPYNEKNIEVFPISSAINSNGLSGKIRLLVSAPKWMSTANRLIQPEDVIMARGPDSIGFLGYLVTRFRKNKRFAKYADQWVNFTGEPLGYRLQKLFYKSRSFGGLVQIYGDSDPKRPHLIPFFTSSVYQAQWKDAGTRIQNMVRPHEPLRCLFVGRLVFAKGVDVIIRSIAQLKKDEFAVSLTIVGDGPERAKLETLAKNLNLGNDIKFIGNVGWASLADLYASSDVFIHASRKEGFGKVIVEAMTFALPIIGTEVGISRELLSPPRCGIIIPPNDSEVLATQIKQVMNNYPCFSELGSNARQKARDYLLENVEQQYREFSRKLLEIPTANEIKN